MVVDIGGIPTVYYQDLVGQVNIAPRHWGEEGEALLFVPGGIMEKRRGPFGCTRHQSIPQGALQSWVQEDLGSVDMGTLSFNMPDTWLLAD